MYNIDYTHRVKQEHSNRTEYESGNIMLLHKYTNVLIGWYYNISRFAFYLSTD